MNFKCVQLNCLCTAETMSQCLFTPTLAVSFAQTLGQFFDANNPATKCKKTALFRLFLMESLCQRSFQSFLSADCGTIFLHSLRASFGSWLCSVLLLLGRWSRDGRVKMSIFFALGLLLFILICIQKATTSFDIVAYKRISEFSAKVGLFSLLFHFFRIVEWQFLRRVGEVQRTFVRDNRIAQLLF